MGVAENVLHSDPVRTITSTDFSNSEEISRSFSMENGDHSFHGPPKYRRRKVSAIRDFPMGCGRFAQHTSLRPTEDATCTGPVENSICIGGSSSRLKNETPDLPKDLHPVVGATPKEEMVPVSVENLMSPPERPIVPVLDGIGLKKSAVRKYPPRRTVSAIRHFPPSCGRNAPRISKEKCPKAFSSLKNKNFVEEKLESSIPDKISKGPEEKLESSIPDKISKEPEEKLESSIPDKISTELVEFDIKQTAEDVQGGVYYKAESRGNDSEVVGDKVQAVLEVHTVGETQKQDDYETISDILVELQDTKEVCTEPPFDRKLFWWDHEFETVEKDNDDGYLEEKLNKEIVVNTEEKNLDEKVSDVSCNRNQLQIVKLENLKFR